MANIREGYVYMCIHTHTPPNQGESTITFHFSNEKSVKEKCCLPYQETKGIATLKMLQPPPVVYPEGTQDGKEQDTDLR